MRFQTKLGWWERVWLSDSAVSWARSHQARKCGMGSSSHHFPYDLSAPLLIASPSDATADHFYVILKMAFGSTPWSEAVRPIFYYMECLNIFYYILGPKHAPSYTCSYVITHNLV